MMCWTINIYREIGPYITNELLRKVSGEPLCFASRADCEEYIKNYKIDELCPACKVEPILTRM